MPADLARPANGSRAAAPPAERLRVDPARLDAIARLGGSTCSTIRGRFDMPTPTLAEWQQRSLG